MVVKSIIQSHYYMQPRGATADSHNLDIIHHQCSFHHHHHMWLQPQCSTAIPRDVSEQLSRSSCQLCPCRSGANPSLCFWPIQPLLGSKKSITNTMYEQPAGHPPSCCVLGWGGITHIRVVHTRIDMDGGSECVCSVIQLHLTKPFVVFFPPQHTCLMH